MSAATLWQIVICTWYVSCLAVVNPGVVAATWWQFVLCQVPCGGSCCCVSCHSVADFAWRMVGQLLYLAVARPATWWQILLCQLPCGGSSRCVSFHDVADCAQHMVRQLFRSGKSWCGCWHLVADRILSTAVQGLTALRQLPQHGKSCLAHGVLAASQWQVLVW